MHTSKATESDLEDGVRTGRANCDTSRYQGCSRCAICRRLPLVGVHMHGAAENGNMADRPRPFEDGVLRPVGVGNGVSLVSKNASVPVSRCDFSKVGLGSGVIF